MRLGSRCVEGVPNETWKDGMGWILRPIVYIYEIFKALRKGNISSQVEVHCN